MGIMTSTAEKAFRKAGRSAHVPDWYRPLSYVAGGVLLVLLVGALLLSGRPSATPEAAVPGGGGVGDIVPGGVIPSSVPSSSTPTGGPAPTGAANPGGGATVTVTLQGGGTAQVAKDALLVAQRGVRGLFTGDFSSVRVRSGFSAPVVVRKWPQAQVGNVRYAIVFPDGSISASFPVDPDGANGPEGERIVDGLVALDGTAWSYQPS